MASDVPVTRDNQQPSNRSSRGSLQQDRSMSPFGERAFDFDRMLDRFFGNRFSPLTGEWPAFARQAPTNIQEEDDCFILTAEIPGIPKEDININVSGNLLTINAESSEQSGEEGSERGYRRQYRRFQESFALPTLVDSNKIEANYENGLLEIYLPKVEEAQPKKIEVQGGKGGFFNRLVNKVEGKSGESEKNVKH